MAVESITILGSSSGRNAGDAALLSGIMDSIDAACGRKLRYEIPSYRPEFIRSSYANDAQPVSMLPWHATVGMFGVPTFRSLRRTDLTIIYDAMLFDRKLFNPLTNYMSTAYLMLPGAKKAGKLLGCFNVGTGPVNTPLGRKMLREIAEMMDFITVREKDSLALLREIGVKNENVVVTADAALNVKPSAKERIDGIMHTLGMENEREILAVNVNAYLNTWAGTSQRALTKEEFADIYAKALDKVAARLGVPLLFVCTQHHDIVITQQVMQRMKSAVKKGIITNVVYSHYDIRGVFERVSMLFAMRLHANILCSAGLTPVCALAFQKKVSSYYALLGLQDYVMSFNDFSAEAIATHVLRSWESRSAMKEKLKEKIPQLQKEALRAATLVSRLVAGKSIDEALQAARA